MKFSAILGHEKEIERLKRAVEGKRIAHAYLFSGPEGIGKRLVAGSFAAALNCSDFSGDSCGVCRSCKMFEAGSHMNLRVEPRPSTPVTHRLARRLRSRLVVTMNPWSCASRAGHTSTPNGDSRGSANEREGRCRFIYRGSATRRRLGPG